MLFAMQSRLSVSPGGVDGPRLTELAVFVSQLRQIDRKRALRGTQGLGSEEKADA